MGQISLLIARPEVADSLVDAVRKGIPLHHACGKVGIEQGQLSTWRRIAMGHMTVWPTTGKPVREETRGCILQLFQRIAQAQAECAANLVDKISNASDERNLKTGLSEWRAGAWLLEHHPSFKEEFAAARHLTKEISGTITHEHRLARTLETEDLLNAVEPPSETLLLRSGNTPLIKEES
mgnify:CR=1 FL=1